MWLRHRRRAGARAGHDGAVRGTARGSRRPGASRRSSTTAGAGCRRSGRCRSRRGPRAPRSRRWPAAGSTAWSGRTVRDAELARRPGGSARRPRCPSDDAVRDDGDRRVAAAGERHEPAEDDPVADLVLRAADDDDGSVGHGLRILALSAMIAARIPARRAATGRGRIARRHARMPRDDRRRAPPGSSPCRASAGGRGRDRRRPRRDRRRPPDAAAGRGLPAGAAARGRRASTTRAGSLAIAPAQPDVRAARGRARSPAASRPGPTRGRTGRASGSGSTAATRTTRPARSCPTSTPRGCCRCSRRGRCCRGTSPGSSGAAATILAAALDDPLGVPPAAARRPRSSSRCSAFPFGANLDTGNINLQLTLMLWARPVHRAARWPGCSGRSRPG